MAWKPAVEWPGNGPWNGLGTGRGVSVRVLPVLMAGMELNEIMI